MIAVVGLHDGDLITVVLLIAFVSFLCFLIARRDKTTRIVRMGIFIERTPSAKTEEKPIPPPTPPPPPPPSTHQIDPSEADTKIDWPEQQDMLSS